MFSAANSGNLVLPFFRRPLKIHSLQGEDFSFKATTGKWELIPFSQVIKSSHFEAPGVCYHDGKVEIKQTNKQHQAYSPFCALKIGHCSFLFRKWNGMIVSHGLEMGFIWWFRWEKSIIVPFMEEWGSVAGHAKSPCVPPFLYFLVLVIQPISKATTC